MVQLRHLVLAAHTRGMKLPSNLGRQLHRMLRKHARDREQEGGVQSISKNTLRFLALAAIALTGCSTSRPTSSCEPMVVQICSRAAEAQLQNGTLMVGYSSRPEEAQVVPFVVPVLRPDGVLATEANCYANTDSHSYSIVRADLAIPPASQESVDFLRGRHLCTDEQSYATDERGRVETAALPLLSR
jgi:hypothetical protein